MRFGQSGSFVLSRLTASDCTLIAESLKQICLTMMGTRVRRRRFGFGGSYFCNINNLSAGIIVKLLRDAIAQGEPRVSVKDITVQAGDPGVMIFTIYYVINGRPTQQALIVEVPT